MLITVSVALSLLFPVASLGSVIVFQHGEGGYPCIRIPAITQCRGRLHAFAECRTRTGDGCIPNGPTSHTDLEASVCYKFSSDGGQTWSELAKVGLPGGIQPTVQCEANSQTLLLQFNQGGKNWQIQSSDGGASWTSAVGVDLGKYNGTDVGPGRGLQLTSKSPVPGRLLFIGHHGAYVQDIVWFSDDGGKTYQMSDTILEHMDEAQLVELPGGVVMANMRNDHLNPCTCRAVSTSSDGGKTFGPISYDSTLISPVCMATIISLSNGSLVFANPASTTSRVHGLVRRSDDGGKTWPRSWQVTDKEELFAYSCLTHVPTSTEVGLLWETSSVHCTGPSCQMNFSTFTVL